MNKTTTKNSMSYNSILSFGVLAAILLISSIGIQSADAAITNQLDLGSRGSDVTQVQTFYSSYGNIYPSNLVTGYFGVLSEAATQRFQADQEIVTNGTPATTGYGRVGPLTMDRLNALMGGTPTSGDDRSPLFSNISVSRGVTSVTITWMSNEPTQGQVYWDTAPLQFNEATGPRQQPYVSGALALDAGGLQTSHSVTILNLQPNTLYYYLIRGVDASGNMGMVWPTFFRTN